MSAPAFYHTPARIIRMAMLDAGRLQRGDDPSAEELSDCMGRLADLIAAWQTQGIKLWLNSLTTVTLVAGTASYTLGPAGTGNKPARVIAGWYVRTGGERRPLDPCSWTDFHSLGNLTQEGEITQYFVDKQQSNLVVKVWPEPSTSCAANGTMQLLIQRQPATPIQLTEAIEFPVEWYMALRWGLADELASGQPTAVVERCMAKAREYRMALEDWDVEDAPTRFTPDSRMMSPNRFR